MAVTASEARKNLFPLIQQVNEDRAPVEITSRNGDAVLMSRADYDALEETAHLLRVPANARHLLESLYWLSADRQNLKRINRLIDDALRDPTSGIGKPEPLRHMLAGVWSRRITEEHRLVYLVDGDDLVILQARFHYS